MLKQNITANFNERMAIAIPSTEVLDELWKKRVNNQKPIKKVMIETMQELAKLNPMGQVHAVELYAAMNCVYRCPPGAVFSLLASSPEFAPVGDLYYRLNNQS
jgi:N12 class adenine-specific DNA methylase